MNHPTVPDAVWRKRLRAFLDAWPRMHEDVAALHQVRVASRRLREALPVLSEGRRLRKLEKARRLMRRIARALGPVRELDVAIKALGDLDPTETGSQAGLEHLREHLVAERAERRAGMTRRLESVTPEKIRRRLSSLIAPDRARKRRETPEGKPPPVPWQSVLSARIARRAKALRSAIDRAGAIYLPDRLHAVRVSVKKLRYAVEVGRDVRAAGAAAMLRALKAAQDTLGHLHDLEMLLDRARAAQVAHKPPSASDEGADLGAVIARLEHDCRQLHARFVARRGDLIAVCDQAESDLQRALAAIRPRPVRILRTTAPHARSPRRDSVADRPAHGARRDDGRHA